nr:PREDICTED: inter-alpha-trypsin inhibitor heavy chain H3-like [Latimeria chalumnae]|eukprot:XP_005991801.1 PREDICTED: inter-alpha-trypsin inhibitor heavy chain H3-like [Latimeria chalumnae]
MDRLLTYLLLISLPVIITADFVITSSEDHETLRNEGHAHARKLIKKRSASDVVIDDIQFYSIKIDCKVTSRFAHNVITSRAVNRANVSKEAFFDVDLPKTAFITNFSMTIDGVVYAGVVKEKKAAQQQYQQAVSRGQTAGLVKATGRKMEKFKVSVNIAAASKVTFELVYEELLKRQFGKYEILIKVKPVQLVKHFQIEAHIFESKGISFLEAEGTFLTNDLEQVVEKSFSGNKGHVSFKPTLNQQRSCSNCSTSRLDGEFTIKYDVNRDHTAGDIQIVNGYFVHYFAPASLPRVPKNVVFVIDCSTSMGGQKIRQTREAFLKILGDIHQDDYFAIILFDSRIEVWKPTLIKATPENIDAAKVYVRNIYQRGATNINDALLKAINLMNQAHESKTVPERSTSMIIFMTDGQPTVGESYLPNIQRNVRNGIQGKYTLYILGFGNDVDYAFLEKLALENDGVARRIYEDSDSALQLQGFYEEVANPMLMQIEMNYPENAVEDLTKTNFKQLYEGSEIVVAGRITDNDLTVLKAEVKALGVSVIHVMSKPCRIAV